MIGFLILIFVIFFYTKSIKVSNQIDSNYTIVAVKKYEYNNLITIKKNNKSYILYTSENYQIGDVVNVIGEVTVFEKYYTPGSFDKNKYYRSVGIYGEIKNYQIEKTNKVNIFHLPKRIIKDKYLKLYFNLDNNENEYFETISELNIYYLISLSGIHIYFLISIIKRIMFYFNLSLRKQSNIILLFLTTISLLSGFSANILRITVYFVLKKIKREHYQNITNYSLLNLSFLIVLFIKPYLIYNKSYLISYLIVNSIFLFMPLIDSSNFFFKQVKTNLLVNVITIVFYLKTNIVSILLSPIYYVLIVFVSFPISLINNFVNNDLLVSINDNIFNLISKTSVLKQTITFYELHYLLIFIYFLLILLTIFAKRYYKVITILLIMIVIIIPSFKKHIKGERFYFLDVGQGDSFVYINNDLVIVVDAFRNVSSFLNYEGINKIDYLILSHSHLDHTLEANDLIKNFRVKNIILSKYDNYHLKNNNSNIIYVESDNYLNLNNVNLFFYGPIKQYSNDNNNSLVFSLTTIATNILFTGDIESQSEFDLIKKYGTLLKSDILKVAHHGSSTSSTIEFISYVRPNLSIISVGRNNNYAFPSYQTLLTLSYFDSTIYRTDQQGTIMINDQNKIKVYKQ